MTKAEPPKEPDSQKRNSRKRAKEAAGGAVVLGAAAAMTANDLIEDQPGDQVSADPVSFDAAAALTGSELLGDKPEGAPAGADSADRPVPSEGRNTEGGDLSLQAHAAAGGGIVGQAADASSAAWEDAINAAGGAVGDAFDAAQDAADAIGIKAHDVEEVFHAVGDAAEDARRPFSKAYWDAQEDMHEEEYRWVDKLDGAAISDEVTRAGDAVGDAVEDAGDAIGDAAEDTGDAIGDAAEDTGDAIGDAAEDANPFD